MNEILLIVVQHVFALIVFDIMFLGNFIHMSGNISLSYRRRYGDLSPEKMNIYCKSLAWSNGCEAYYVPETDLTQWEGGATNTIKTKNGTYIVHEGSIGRRLNDNPSMLQKCSIRRADTGVKVYNHTLYMSTHGNREQLLYISGAWPEDILDSVER